MKSSVFLVLVVVVILFSYVTCSDLPKEVQKPTEIEKQEEILKSIKPEIVSPFPAEIPKHHGDIDDDEVITIITDDMDSSDDEGGHRGGNNIFRENNPFKDDNNIDNNPFQQRYRRSNPLLSPLLRQSDPDVEIEIIPPRQFAPRNLNRELSPFHGNMGFIRDLMAAPRPSMDRSFHNPFMIQKSFSPVSPFTPHMMPAGAFPMFGGHMLQGPTTISLPPLNTRNDPFSSLASVFGSVVSDFPAKLREILKAQDKSSHQPKSLHLEKKDTYYVVSGWFPEMKREDLKIKLEGSQLFVSGVSPKSPETANQELIDVDSIDQEMTLPYAPNPQLFKAHYDDEKHFLTAVFPLEQTTEVQLS